VLTVVIFKRCVGLLNFELNRDSRGKLIFLLLSVFLLIDLVVGDKVRYYTAATINSVELDFLICFSGTA
jgi:hypothetical protein